MRGICPSCEKEAELTLRRETEIVEVRGEPIEVEAEYYTCTKCGEAFENTRGADALAAAYAFYRRRYGLLQPEEIKTWRKSLGLTQRELSDILGWGGATLSRYENGALQSEAHEKMLRLAMEPHNLLRLIEESPAVLAADKRGRLLGLLAEAESESRSFERMFEERFGRYEPDEYSGFQRLYVHKLLNAILFFCTGGGQLKTKLNKLLFYADFRHFKDYTTSLTGVRYVHLPHGPVPDNYDYYIAELIREGALDVDEVPAGDYVGENHVARRQPDLSVFSEAELKTLAEIKDYFKTFSSTRIRQLSHEETAYKETEDGQTISYRYAADLAV